MRTKAIFSLTAGLLSVALLPQTLLAAAGIPIEQVQRELQARYYSLQNTHRSFPFEPYLTAPTPYLVWPQCVCGTPAPHFPKDGYYGDLDKNPALAVELVNNLIADFFNSGIISCFVKTPDGVTGIENLTNTSYGNSYSSSDFADIDPATITVTPANYASYFALVKNYIEQLNYVEAIGLIYPAPSNDAWCGSAWATETTCASAISSAIASDSFEWAGFSPGGRLGLTTSAINDGDGWYTAHEIHYPGQVEAYCAFTGSMNVFFTVYPNIVDGANSVGFNTPPVTADRCWHLYASTNFAVPDFWLSPEFCVDPPTNIQCNDYGSGWYMYEGLEHRIFGVFRG